MTNIFDLFDNGLFNDMLLKGYIRIQTHPDFPELAIANYTETAAFERVWNDVTRTCRGLIWNLDTHEVLARPFPKFFNFDEKEAPRILDDQIVYSYSNKYDGSLGIAYLRPDGLVGIATRGSFASDQAFLGTELLHSGSKLADETLAMIVAGYTPLFEICGPDNRIVLRYDENFLALLGYMHIETGMYVPPSTTEGMGRTMRSLLMDLSRSNAEGWVVWKTAYEAVKLKQADYVELHRVVTNLSQKEVWRQLRAGTYNSFRENLPDEWWEWAENVADHLRDKFAEIFTYAEVCQVGMGFAFAGQEPTRKEQAAYITSRVEPEFRGFVFGLLDGKDISDAIWRQLEPKGDQS